MKQKKYTKHALLMSLLSLLMCCSMLVGTTFAWFTDSVASGNNKIVAGNLDIELEYATAFNEDGSVKEWSPVTETTNLFKQVEEGDDLWEPGHTEVTYLRVRNAGSLALKYNLSASVYGDEYGAPEKLYTSVLKEEGSEEHQTFKLSDYLVFNVLEGASRITDRAGAWMDGGETAEKEVMGSLTGLEATDTALYPKGTEGKDSEKVFTLAVYMPTWVGNEANYLTGTEVPTIYIGLKVAATQLPYENDSFDDQYDTDATYPVIEDLAKADGSLTFTFPGVTPTLEGATVVEFPEGSFTPGDKVTLTVDTAKVAEEDIEGYPEVSGSVPVAAIDLTLTVNGKPASSFNAKTVTVTTQIETGREDVKVYHDGEGVEKDYLTDYAPDTGALTFATDHFSKYIVYAAPGETSRSIDTWHTLKAGPDFNKIAIPVGTSIPTYDRTTKDIKFGCWSEYAAELASQSFEDGKIVDEAEAGTVRIFFAGDDAARTMYVLTKQDNEGIRLNTNCNTMLKYFKVLETVYFGTGVDFSQVTTMRECFVGDEKLYDIDQAHFDTSHVTDMYYMFQACYAITDEAVKDLDVSNVENFCGIFKSAIGLRDDVDFSSWDISNATDISSMFSYCDGMTSIILPKASKDTVVSMEMMFYYCDNLNSLPDFSDCKLKPSKISYMFEGTDLETVTFADLHLDTSEVTKALSVFSHCDNLSSANFDDAKFPKCGEMDSLLSSCPNLKTASFRNVDFGDLFKCSDMFYNTTNLETVDFTDCDTSGVTNMSSMFYSSGVKHIVGLNSFDTSKVTNMSSMFYNCEALAELDLSSFNTSQVTDFSYMFSISKEPGKSNCAMTELDISSFSTESAVKMKEMFKFRDRLATVYASDRFNATHITTDNSKDMFYRCSIKGKRPDSVTGEIIVDNYGSYEDARSAKITTPTNRGGRFTDVALKDQVSGKF